MGLGKKRYTEAQLEGIKSNISILDIFRDRGFKLEKQGKNYATLCPFHDDKQPSLIITPENNLWNCLGACRTRGIKSGGDNIEFVMKYENKTFLEAVDTIAAKNSAAKIKKQTHPLQKIKLLNKVAELYHQSFKEDPRGQNYLKSRGIFSAVIINTFKIGIANGSIFKSIPDEGEIVDLLTEVGLLSKKGYELFKDCVVFPLYDVSGNVVQMYGRKITEEKVKHLYLPGGHKGLFNRTTLKAYNEIILTESIIDALSLYSSGYKNVMPCYGINGLIEEHIQSFRVNKTKKITILFDGDIAGRQAAKCAKDTLEGELQTYLKNFSCRIVALPEGEDANSLWLKNPEQLKQIAAGPKEAQKPGYTKGDDGLILNICRRKYFLRGIEKNRNKLKANIKAVNCAKFHIDTIDLYLARDRKNFIKDASLMFSEEIEIIEQDFNRIIDACEDYLKKGEDVNKGITITEADMKEATAFGQHSNLIENIIKDIEKTGFIGEEMNKLMSYLAMTSRKMEDPLSILIISGSGAGKSSLQDAILNLCPPEDLVRLTALSGRALFYKDEFSLKNKILAIEEEQGALDASYAIRNLISSKKLSIEATVKDTTSGKMTTMENQVKGPTAVFKTTTNPDTDPETKSRFITLSVDESREQTQKILDFQRKSFTLEGHLQKSQKKQIIHKHQNFQRLLKPLVIFNPYADLLSYLDDRIMVRRENPKYMNIINTVAFLHQMQREIKTYKPINQQTNKPLNQAFDYIEVTLEDIQMAGDIAHNILGKSLDELSAPSRNLLNIIHKMVTEQAQANKDNITFTRRIIREYSKWSDYQIKTHIKQLEELEYLIPLSGCQGKLFAYKLAYNGEGQNGEKFILGLINIEELRQKARKVGLNR